MESQDSPYKSTGCDIVALHVFDPLCLLMLACLCESAMQNRPCLFLWNVQCSSRHLDEVICVNRRCTYQVKCLECSFPIPIPSVVQQLNLAVFYSFVSVSAFDMLSVWKFTAPCHSSSSNLLMCHSVSYVMNKHADVQRDECWLEMRWTVYMCLKGRVCRKTNDRVMEPKWKKPSSIHKDLGWVFIFYLNV